MWELVGRELRTSTLTCVACSLEEEEYTDKVQKSVVQLIVVEKVMLLCGEERKRENVMNL